MLGQMVIVIIVIICLSLCALIWRKIKGFGKIAKISFSMGVVWWVTSIYGYVLMLLAGIESTRFIVNILWFPTYLWLLILKFIHYHIIKFSGENPFISFVPTIILYLLVVIGIGYIIDKFKVKEKVELKKKVKK